MTNSATKPRRTPGASTAASQGAADRTSTGSGTAFAFRAPGERLPLSLFAWQSSSGVPLTPELPRFRVKDIAPDDRTIWRYGAMLPLPPGCTPVSLGEGGTPMVVESLLGLPVRLKLEFLQPTGSYKDRGSAVLATAARAEGVRRAVEDSSGNAGASLAAYLGRCGVALELFVPRGTAGSRIAQAQAYGATVDTQSADRTAAGDRARERSGESVAYASHVHSPYFLAGLTTLAYELWEDLDRAAPDNLVVPVGNGILLLGCYYGFHQLLQARRIDRMPRILGVQARACSPLYQSFVRGADVVLAAPARATAATGIAVADPPRGAEVLAAVRDTGGAMLSVSEGEIRRAQALLANIGWYVEPTSASAVAAVMKLDKVLEAGDVTVVPLTGSGLKAPPSGDVLAQGSS